jgi:glutamate formiminotransferase/formiminotetrahydrofolate cyclodeaminase
VQRLLECVPNFSEGRRPDVVQSIVAAAQSVDGVHVLDLHSDADHNRSVLTLAGESDALSEAVFRAIKQATESIDLRAHSGEHPRIGATDVVPFIPLGTSSMSDAVAAARSLGERVAKELELPVYFYEEAALRPERQNLEAIRRKGFEELRDVIGDDPERQPDIGPSSVHPSAGAVVIGARGPLIAYNIYLNTSDVRIAKAIAKAIRHSSGGLRYVKALGLDIPARGQAQVSMNLTNYQKSAVHTVFELVRALAESYGASITDSEVVGLVPMEALVNSARHYLRMHDFASDQILESKLLEG